MSTTDDLSPPQAPNRVYYSLGRMLGVEDFQADQDYHRGRLARAILQLCGTGTLSGLNVQFNQTWQPNASYPQWSFVVDPNNNIQVNTGSTGNTSGGTEPKDWATAPAGQTVDNNITWTNEGPMSSNIPVWTPNTLYALPSVIVDPNFNLQVLTTTSPLTSGQDAPQYWNGVLGGVTPDGNAAAAWTCIGAQDLEIQVTAGIAIDRVGRIIEVPRAVCIRIGPWWANQTVSDLNLALHGTSVVVDVFATFVGCTRGVTPCFATQDDYSATDAFSPNRLLDSFAMQLVLRTDATPELPRDPWLGIGATPLPPNLAAAQQLILAAALGPGASAPFGSVTIPVEFPPNFDTSSVFLARIQIPATPVAPPPGGSEQPPTPDFTKITIDNLSRIFLYPPSLVARWIGFSSGAES
ncbi:MAG: hypothetical protein WCC84_07180 [Candidatus Cybelea sp.]